MTAVEKTMRTIESQGELDSASNPNATPGLLVCTRLISPGITTRSEPACVNFCTANFDAWSATSTMNARSARLYKPVRDESWDVRIPRSLYRPALRFHEARQRSARRFSGRLDLRQHALNSSSSVRTSSPKHAILLFDTVGLRGPLFQCAQHVRRFEHRRCFRDRPPHQTQYKAHVTTAGTY